LEKVSSIFAGKKFSENNKKEKTAAQRVESLEQYAKKYTFSPYLLASFEHNDQAFLASHHPRSQ
jgi:hypothetical protein